MRRSRLGTTVIFGAGVALAALPGCQMNERSSGAAIGGASGVLLGAVAVETFSGALLGGVAGAVAGYIIGDYLADQRERARMPCPQPCPAPSPYGPQPQAPSPYGYGDPRVGFAPAGDPSVAVPDVVPAAWNPRARARDAYARGRVARTAPEARAAYEESVRLDPSFAEAWNALGLNAHYAGRHDDAVRYFEQALRADPTLDAARTNLAMAR